MTAPTGKVRQLTYSRDGRRCVCCGATSPLQWQHRAASGHGGRGKKAPALTPADGVTACATCNQRFEGDLQETALRCGWKLRRHMLLAADQVPFFDRNLGVFVLPDVHGDSREILRSEALELIAAAGGYTKGGQ